MLPALSHRRGLVIFPKGKEVCLYWQTDSPGAPGLYGAKSHDGQKFSSSIDFVTYTRANGTKVLPGNELTVRANAPDAGAELVVSEKGKPSAFVRLNKHYHWQVVAQSSLFTQPTVVVKIPGTRKIKTQYLAFSTKTGRTIFQAHSKSDLSHFREGDVVLRARTNHFDLTELAPLYTELQGSTLLLVYTAKNAKGRPTLGAALFEKHNPTELIWRSDFPLWELPPKHPASTLRFLGGFHHGRYFSLYVESKEKGIECFPIAEYWKAPRQAKLPDTLVLPKRKTGIKITLERVASNPILEPRAAYAWEAFASFNPAAIALDGRIHLLYRAQGYDGQSVLGYAGSSDGIQIDERSPNPVFVPSRAKSIEESLYPYTSGGGTGGCEDPRLVEIDGMVYLIYVAFDGSHPPGVALASLSTKNFLAKRWRWSEPRLISRPGQIQKNWVLFPEKIHGKFAILHGLTPTIKIEYLDSLSQLGKTQYIESLSSHGGRGYIDSARLEAWDNIVRGTGAPPIPTKRGWLVFYHGMDMRDPGKYKVGAMLLDKQYPERILRRALEPVLEPETEYENSGHKRGVVYVCGAVVKGDTLFVYYGASDRTTAVATANLDTFLNDLWREKPPTLKKMNIRKRS